MSYEAELKQAAHAIRQELTEVIERHKVQDAPADWRRWYLVRIGGLGHAAVIREAFTFAEREIVIPESIYKAYTQAQAALKNLQEAIDAEVGNES